MPLIDFVLLVQYAESFASALQLRLNFLTSLTRKVSDDLVNFVWMHLREVAPKFISNSRCKLHAKTNVKTMNRSGPSVAPKFPFNSRCKLHAETNIKTMNRRC